MLLLVYLNSDAAISFLSFSRHVFARRKLPNVAVHFFSGEDEEDGTGSHTMTQEDLVPLLSEPVSFNDARALSRVPAIRFEKTKWERLAGGYAAGKVHFSKISQTKCVVYYLVCEVTQMMNFFGF